MHQSIVTSWRSRKYQQKSVLRDSIRSAIFAPPIIHLFASSPRADVEKDAHLPCTADADLQLSAYVEERNLLEIFTCTVPEEGRLNDTSGLRIEEQLFNFPYNWRVNSHIEIIVHDAIMWLTIQRGPIEVPPLFSWTNRRYMNTSLRNIIVCCPYASVSIRRASNPMSRMI